MAVYTVSQVSQHVKEVLENDPLLADVLVEGEVSNLRVSSAGHSYFSLKDDQALLNCVMFRGQPGAELLASGSADLTHGRLQFCEPRGSTDFMVDLAMAAGVGELALELERLTLRLEAEGLFEQSRKRSLPLFPKVIGVVTSPSGAVLHDIQNVLRRRYPLAELLLAPSLVQGPNAAGELVAAIEGLTRDGRADVIVLARGGGALEELWPFNEEEVARAIYASRIPTVSAIGHETDFTISDRVADLRAPTPSAAAEIVVPDQYVLRQQLDEILGYFDRIRVYHADSRRSDVARMSGILEGILPDTNNWRRRVDDVARSAGIALVNRLKLTRLQVENRQDRIRTLDPVATLRRGYSVVQKGTAGDVVTKVGQVEVGDSLSITVSDGIVDATAGGTAKPQPAKRKKAGATAAGMERLL
ncbi:MAG: exodeoxyribonuclease VII large subunit [Dehalococcoidia bacterium]|nr:exodeoxyribonuclease VII large subunit [Dehalococcoidia bacterium]